MDEKEEKRKQLDSRSQDRYLKHNLLSQETLTQYLASLPDVESQAVSSTLAQPALGVFDAETLARVQRNFPYYNK